MAGQAPSLLYILLWHHSRYFQRGWFILLAIVLLPPTICILLNVAVQAFVDGSLGEPEVKAACQFAARALPSSGPLLYFTLMAASPAQDMCYSVQKSHHFERYEDDDDDAWLSHPADNAENLTDNPWEVYGKGAYINGMADILNGDAFHQIEEGNMTQGMNQTNGTDSQGNGGLKTAVSFCVYELAMRIVDRLQLDLDSVCEEIEAQIMAQLNQTLTEVTQGNSTTRNGGGGRSKRQADDQEDSGPPPGVNGTDLRDRLSKVEIPESLRRANVSQELFTTIQSLCNIRLCRFDLVETYHLFRGHILYFPQNELTDGIMEQVQKVLTVYEEWHEVDVPTDAPQPIREGICWYKLYKKCFLPVKPRLIGFPTAEAAIDYAWEQNLTQTPEPEVKTRIYNFQPDSTPGLWALVDFSQATEKNVHYKIIFDKNGQRHIYGKTLYAQDVIERAVILHATGGFRPENKIPFQLQTRKLPHKCQRNPNGFAHFVLFLILPFVFTLAFLLAPAHALNQMVIEKSLRLREYLEIMGVGSLKLKLSWALFYLLLLVPVSMICAEIVFNMEPDYFAYTSRFVIFALLTAYNIAQLAFCFLLASVISKPGSTTILLAFGHIFIFIVALFLFPNVNRLFGGTAKLAYVLSLHVVVPLTLGMKYLVTFRVEWDGVRLDNMFGSPFSEDEYGGIGTCITFLLGDAVLYTVLSWYIEKVFPGDFGVKHSPIFFLKPSYWTKPSKRTNADQEYKEEKEGTADIEPVSKDLEAGIMIDRLTKHYNESKIGVTNLTINFYKKEVTSFLGHNGAGKSTTMNTLVGMLSPSSGKAFINGKSVLDEMYYIRRELGFVPQYDILYPSLSLEDHLIFYGWLKGKSRKDLVAKMTPYLEAMDLMHVRKAPASKLSGGQKRKLSLLSAYMGDPSCLILDEPTSGVDPFSRHEIWNLILQHRKTATTILSTHQMQEAEVLSDRIAIISHGQLKCCGTTMYLKDKYGHGFKISVVCRDKHSQIETENFFKENMTAAEIHRRTGNDVTFTIPRSEAQSEHLLEFLRSLEDAQEELGFISYGVSEPTMDEVFFNATDIVPAEKDDKLVAFENGQEKEMSAAVKFEKVTGIGFLFNQMHAMILKRIRYTSRSKSTLAYQIFLPLSFIALMLVIGEQLSKEPNIFTRDIHLKSPYFYTNAWFTNVNEPNGEATATGDFFRTMYRTGLGPMCGGAVSSYCHSGALPNESLPVFNISTDFNTTYCKCNDTCGIDDLQYDGLPNSFTMASQDELYSIYKPNGLQLRELLDWTIQFNNTMQGRLLAGGFQLQKIDQNTTGAYKMLKNVFGRMDFTLREDLLTIWTKPSTILASLNGFNNALMRHITRTSDYSISIELDSRNLNPEYQSALEIFSTLISNTITSLFVGFAFAFASFGSVVFIMYERNSGLKKLQFIVGANRIIYWTINFLADLVLFLITMILIFILMSSFENSFKDSLKWLYIVTIPYGFALVSMSCLLSLVFKSPRGVLMFIVIAILCCICTASFISVFEMLETVICPASCSQRPRNGLEECIERCSRNAYWWARPAANILRCFPPYLLMDGTILVAVFTSFAYTMPQLLNFEPEDIDQYLEDLMGDIYRYELLGKYPYFGLGSAAVYFLLTLIWENFNLDVSLSCCSFRKKKQSQMEVEMAAGGEDKDHDVEKEEERIAEIVAKKEGYDPLMVYQLTKDFTLMPRPAVNEVSFGVSKGQCFGLLGINGAGKSTTFKMLTGYLKPSQGQALIEQVDVAKSPNTANSYMGYCPQENILFDQMSVREHLVIFSMLAGVPKTIAKEKLIPALIEEVGLDIHVKKLASQLSGGNQRKLQLALALMGYRPVIFLDEPTSGMDPGARRQTWSIVNRAVTERSCSVILTSHSMEECEALCHRLVIMVCGKPRCIGSVQYLKDKFGNKYTFKFRFSADKPESAEDIKAHVMAKLGKSAILLEQHTTMLAYEIYASKLKRLSDLFTVIHEAREKFAIQNFTVSQITLEDVFVNFAQTGSKKTEEDPNAVEVMEVESIKADETEVVNKPNTTKAEFHRQSTASIEDKKDK